MDERPLMVNNLEESGKPDHHVLGGLTIVTAAIFITGEMAGTGLLALPKAMDQAGWYGLISTVVLCVLSGYSGIKLGDCWMLLRQMNSEYCEEGCRSPFQAIATEGLGKVGKYILIFVIYFQLLGAGVIFLILSAQNLHSLFDKTAHNPHVCIWILIVAVVLMGPCWLGTPKDSWLMAVGAMLCTAIACIFILISTLKSYAQEERKEPSSEITFESFSTSMGTMFFAWGGSAMFPTIQVDMQNPHKFHIAVFISYAILLVFYLPVSIAGYIAFGHKLEDNILDNLNKDFFRYAVEILITGHLATAFTIVLNPVFQGLEDVLNVPKKFSWKRAVTRSLLILFLAFIAESIPHFGPILSFIGSSTVSILGFILPVFCFVAITYHSTRMPNESLINNIFRNISIFDIVLLICSLIIGLYGAIASSYSSFAGLVSPDTFVKPCWLNISAADPVPPSNDGNSTLVF